jgi:hypothetical protein
MPCGTLRKSSRVGSRSRGRPIGKRRAARGPNRLMNSSSVSITTSRSSITVGTACTRRPLSSSVTDGLLRRLVHQRAELKDISSPCPQTKYPIGIVYCLPVLHPVYVNSMSIPLHRRCSGGCSSPFMIGFITLKIHRGARDLPGSSPACGRSLLLCLEKESFIVLCVKGREIRFLNDSLLLSTCLLAHERAFRIQ